MRLPVFIAALLTSAPAFAGGVGPLVMGGIHTEDVYYYANRADNGAGARIQDPADYEQFRQGQILGHIGSGLELVLGDRDDLIQGVFRVYWMMDTPQADPANGADLVDPANTLVAAWRENNRHIGVGTIGLNWGILRAAQDKFKFGVSAHFGTGFVTPDDTEFFLGQAGVNVNYAITRTLEVYGDFTYGIRARKEISHGLYTTAGLRVLFD
jgi:hypothetical protein